MNITHRTNRSTSVHSYLQCLLQNQWLRLHGLGWALQEAGHAGAYLWHATGQMSYNLPNGNSDYASSDCELVKCDLLIHMGIFNDQLIQSIDYYIHRLNSVSQRVYFNVYAHIPTADKN